MPGSLEARLPAHLVARADIRGGEAGWRRADLPALADAARAAGLATFGGQPQLRGDEVAELYWMDFDPTPRRSGEPWPDFVERSWKELLFLVAGLPDDAVIAGEEPVESLWFVTYLEAEPDASDGALDTLRGT